MEKAESVNHQLEVSVDWKEVDFDTGKRKFHTMTLFKKYIIIFGGDNGKTEIAEIIIYEFDKNSWKQGLIMGEAPEARQGHSACLNDGNKIVFYGGINKDGVLNTTEMLVLYEEDELLLEWKRIETFNNEDLQRYSHSAEVYNNHMYIFGGADFDRISTNQLWSLNFESMIWKLHETTGDIPSKRHFHSSFFYNGKIYIFGGYSAESSSYLKDFFFLDLETMNWKSVLINGYFWPSPRSGVSVCQRNGLAYFFGGYTRKGHSNDLFTFNINKSHTELINFSQKPPAPRAYHQSVIYKNNLIIFGGKSKKEVCSSLFSIYLDPIVFENISHAEDLNKPKKSIYLDQMRNMLFNKLHSDICFEVEGQEFPCHRIILSARCKYFQNMFSSNMIESHSDKVNFPDIDPQTFKALVEFIYCDEVKLDENLALNLLGLSDKFFLSDLKSVCEEFLCQRLTLDNFVDRAKISEKYDATLLKNAIVDFGVANMSEFQQRDDASELPVPFFLKIISKLQLKVMKLEAHVKAMNKKLSEE